MIAQRIAAADTNQPTYPFYNLSRSVDLRVLADLHRLFMRLDVTAVLCRVAVCAARPVPSNLSLPDHWVPSDSTPRRASAPRTAPAYDVAATCTAPSPGTET